MANAPSFVDHALDLLSLLGPVQARAMFGAHGLYLRGVMFGLLDDDELFLKTDEATRAPYLAADCRMWVYPGAKETPYYRPPDDAHEDPEAMLAWARPALDVALRLHAAKVAKKAAAAARRAAREKKAAAQAKAAPAAKRKGKAKAKAAPSGKPKPAQRKAPLRPARTPAPAAKPARRAARRTR